MNLISKSEAKKLGLKFYFSGIPCKNNQTAKRRVSDTRCQCEHCIAEDRQRDKLRSGRKQKYYIADPVKFCDRSKEWRQNNPDKYREIKQKRRAARFNATPPWYGELDEFVLMQAHELCQLRRNATGIDWNIDHMIPLQAKNVCGLHVWNNFQVIPARLNSAKCNKLIYTNPHEWIRGV